MKNYKRSLCLVVFSIILVLTFLFTAEYKAYAEDAETVPLAIKYDDFDGTTITDMLQLNGKAEITDPSVIQLTHSDTTEAESGSVFSKNKIHLADDLSFSTYFQFEISNFGGFYGEMGEGFAFTLQAAGNDVVGGADYSMGTSGIEPSVSIEFDTRIQDEPNEGDSQHVAVFFNGNYDDPVVRANLPNNITPSEGFMPPNHVWIEYDGTNKTMKVWLNDHETRPGENEVITFTNLDLESVFKIDNEDIRDVYVGFTASTSEEAQSEHSILRWYFKNNAGPIDFNPDTSYVDASKLVLTADPTSGEASSTVTAAVYGRDYDSDVYTPKNGIPVTFSTSFGSLHKNTVVSNVYGKASVTLNPDYSGIAYVTAVAEGGAFAEVEVQLYNPAGDIAKDMEWLTYERVLKGNDSKDSVVDNVYLPTSGPHGSSISWKSSDDTVVDLNGEVTRPPFNEEDETITLTATISKDNEQEKEKTFTITVKAEEQIDEDSLAADKEWLTVYRTLGDNVSQYAIVKNLNLMDSALNGSKITWTSDSPDVISNNGEVTRPEYQQEHQSVIITATFPDGSTKEFEYTVLAKADDVSQDIESTTPANNSIDVPYNDRQITVDFDEDIEKGEGWNNIKVGYFDMVRTQSNAWERKFIEVDSSARIDDYKLIITLDNNLESLRYYEVLIPKNAVEDGSGNNMSDDFTLSYKAEKVYTDIPLQVEVANPANKDNTVWPGIQKMTFNYGDDLNIYLSKGDAFDDITLYNSSDEEFLPVSRELDGNTVTLELESGTKLQLGKVYEIRIPSGAVQDKFDRKNPLETITFKTRDENIAPEITAVYPADGAKDISVHQNIDISFSEKVSVSSWRRNIKLMDDKGNVVSKAVKYHWRDKMVIYPSYLQPETEYTLLIPKDSIKDYNGNMLEDDYEIKFTTGANSLEMEINDVKHTQSNAPVSPLSIQFSSPVMRGPNFDELEIIDSQGNSIQFESQETDNNVLLKPLPDGEFEDSQTYTVKIPRGAYKSKNNDDELNDSLRFEFTTVKKMDISNCHILTTTASRDYFTGVEVNFTPDYIYSWLSIPYDTSTELEKYFRLSGFRNITSYKWTINDGDKEIIQNGDRAKYTFTEAGTHQVTLEFSDSYGFSYKLETKVIVKNPVENKIDFFYTGNMYFVKDNKSPYTFFISVEGNILQTSNWKAFLYKGTKEQGNLVKKLNVERGISSYYKTTLDYYGLDTGDYQLVVQYEDLFEPKEIRKPIRIGDSPKSMQLEFYDDEKESFLTDWEELQVKVNGISTTAKRKSSNNKNLNPDSDYWYEISNLSSFGQVQIQVIPPYSYSSANTKVDAENGTIKLIKLSHYPVPRIVKSEARYSEDGTLVGKYAYNGSSIDFEIETGGSINESIEVVNIQFRTSSGYYFPTKYYERDGNHFSVYVQPVFDPSKEDRLEARVTSVERVEPGKLIWHHSPWTDLGIMSPPLPPFI